MAFTVEDGTGLADANSYCDVAFADDYFADRGITEWTGTDTVKQQALIKATDYIEKRFEGFWRGVKVTLTQALAWPRTNSYGVSPSMDLPYFYITRSVVDDLMYDPNNPSLPAKLKQATAEYALRALSAPLLPDPEDGGNQAVIRKMEKVGPLEEETEWAMPTTLIKAYPAADRLLRSLTIPPGAIR